MYSRGDYTYELVSFKDVLDTYKLMNSVRRWLLPEIQTDEAILLWLLLNYL